MTTFEEIPDVPSDVKFSWYAFLKKIKNALDKLIGYWRDADDAWNYPNLLNNWEPYGTAEYPGDVGYKKGPNNWVRITGLVKSGTPGNTSVVFILPVGYRPPYRLVFGTCCNGIAIARVDVSKNGEVIIYAGHTGWTTLDGISFEATH